MPNEWWININQIVCKATKSVFLLGVVPIVQFNACIIQLYKDKKKRKLNAENQEVSICCLW